MDKKTVLTKNYYILKKKHFTNDELNILRKELTVKPICNINYDLNDNDDDVFTLYFENKNKFKIPKFYGLEKYGEADKIKKYEYETLKDIAFILPLREKQIIATAICIEKLKEKGGCLLCAGCGFGKSASALFIWIAMNVPLLIIVHKHFLLNQWKETIEKFVPEAKIGLIQGKNIDFDGKDVVIGMLQSVCKDKYDKSVFNRFGMVIVDECHHISSKVFSKALPIIATKYMLGLSATPERKDGLSKVFKWYLGDIAYTAASMNQFKVLMYQVHIKSENETYSTESRNFRNQVMIATMINNLCNYEFRNRVILEYIKKLSYSGERQIMILSSRRNHLGYLKNEVDRLGFKNKKDEIITTGFYVGGNSQSKKKILELKDSESKNVIFGTYDMAREGLDIPTLNTLILASPMSEVEQAIGRIMRKKTEINPVIIDIVDGFSIFKAMGYKRLHLYKKNRFINKKEVFVAEEKFKEQVERIDFSNVNKIIEDYEQKTLLLNVCEEPKEKKDDTEMFNFVDSD
jgi:superfamily II DNA or RNA helicase